MILFSHRVLPELFEPLLRKALELYDQHRFIDAYKCLEDAHALLTDFAWERHFVEYLKSRCVEEYIASRDDLEKQDSLETVAISIDKVVFEGIREAAEAIYGRRLAVPNFLEQYLTARFGRLQKHKKRDRKRVAIPALEGVPDDLERPGHTGEGEDPSKS